MIWRIYKKRIYAAVNSVTLQMFHTTWVEVEYRLGISCATNGSHVEVYGTEGKKTQFSFFVAIGSTYIVVLVQKL